MNYAATVCGAMGWTEGFPIWCSGLRKESANSSNLLSNATYNPVTPHILHLHPLCMPNMGF
jgi:hypothetical protein